MVSASSVIRVDIIGDAKKLTSALGEANKSTGGLLKAAGGAFLASAAVGTAFDFAQSSLDKADAMADAFDRLDALITPEFSKQVEDVAFNFTGIGLSADEVGTMAANFAALATAAGVTKPLIADLTPDLLDVASAIAAKTGKPLDEVISDIGKAAAGNQKSVADYGIVIDKSLNPDAQILSILQQAEALFGSGKDAANDYAGAQENLGAKWDNFSIKVGQALEGPLSGVLDFFITIVDRDIPNMMKGFDDAGRNIDNFARTVAAPLGNIADLLGGIGDFFGMNHSTTLDVNMTRSDRELLEAVQREERRNSGPQGRD